eukprot:145219-Pelagomonas_calceolata.AAC.13
MFSYRAPAGIGARVQARGCSLLLLAFQQLNTVATSSLYASGKAGRHSIQWSTWSSLVFSIKGDIH